MRPTGDERDAAFRLAFLMTGNAERAAATAGAALARATGRSRRRLRRALVRQVLGPWYRRIFLRDDPAWPGLSGEVGVWPAVLRLSPVRRTVLVLSLVDGLAPAEVGALLGAPRGAIERILAGALAAVGAHPAEVRAALEEVAAAVEVPPALDTGAGTGAPTRGRGSWPWVLGAAAVAGAALLASGVAGLRAGGGDGAGPTPAGPTTEPTRGPTTGPVARRTAPATATPTIAEPWRALPDAPVGAAAGAVAVFTGRSFVVWGVAGAATYDAEAGSWQPIPGAGAVPEGATAVWTGQQVVAVGAPDRAVAVDPTAGTATALPGPPTSVVARPAAVWTGSEVLVWGGRGVAFDPARRRWGRLPASGLDPRSGAVGAWTGDRMLVWGGDGAADGASYDPARRRWKRLPPAPLRSGTGAVGAWDGRSLVVATPQGAAAYDPVADRWRPLPPVPFRPVGAAAVHGDVVVIGDGGEAAVLVRALAGEVWVPLPAAPGPFGVRPAVAAGDVLVVAGRTVAVLQSTSPPAPPSSSAPGRAA